MCPQRALKDEINQLNSHESDQIRLVQMACIDQDRVIRAIQSLPILSLCFSILRMVILNFIEKHSLNFMHCPSLQVDL